MLSDYADSDDLFTFAAVCVLLTSVALVATIVLVLRATGLEPLKTLRKNSQAQLRWSFRGLRETPGPWGFALELRKKLERPTGLEPVSPAWEAGAQPIYQGRYYLTDPVQERLTCADAELTIGKCHLAIFLVGRHCRK